MLISKFNLQKSDFNSMMINPFISNPYSIPIIQKYPELNPTNPNFDKLITLKYIAIAFDKKSPIRMQTNDPIEQRITAAEIVGFPKTSKGKFTLPYEKIIKSQNFTVNIMVITYLFLQNEHKFITLIAYEEALRIQAAKIVDPEISPSEVKQSSQNIETLQQSITNIKKSIVEEPSDTLLNRDLFTFTQAKRFNIKPEDYAPLFNIKNPQTNILKNTPH